MTIERVQRSVVSIPFTVYSPRFKGRAYAAYLGSTLVHQVGISTLVAIVITVAAGVLYAADQSGGMAGILLALSVASVGALLREFMRCVLLAQLRVWANLAMGLVANIATIGALLWAYMTSHLSAPIAYLIMAVCYGVPALVTLLFKAKQLTVVRQQITTDLWKNVRFGRWPLLGSALQFFAIRLYPWALVCLFSVEDAAVYGACITITHLANPLLLGVGNWAGPKAAHIVANSGPRSLSRFITYLQGAFVAVLIPYVVVLTIWGKQLVPVLFTNKYSSDTLTITLLALAVALDAIILPRIKASHAVGRPQIQPQASAISAAASVTIGIPLVWAFGIKGAAAGLLIARAAAAMWMLLQWRNIGRGHVEVDMPGVPPRCDLSKKP